jgi:Na+:H+ antiporter, NhaA family
MASPPGDIFGDLTPSGKRNLLDTLRAENTGAILLLAGAVIALLWANSPWRQNYQDVSNIVVGPESLHLDLTLAQWATDGLLAIFFFVVGLELKREIVDGQLRRPATAVVPIIAAIGGMAVPAALYAAVNLASENGSPQGWAVPVATDIAFAVAVLTVFGKRLPNALRAFLLTLAVVDDLLGIIVIAVFYSEGLQLAWLGAVAAAVILFAVGVRSRRVPGWALILLAVTAWGFMHASGVHATIAGVVLGFTVPALARPGEDVSVAERYEHRWRPVSAGLAVPVFALFASGVSLSLDSLQQATSEPAAQGVALGLIVGKPVGILLATALLVKFTHATLHPTVRWPDIVAVSVVAGIGFTVSLLIGELSFESGSPQAGHVKAAVLISSLTAAAVGAVLLRWREHRHHRNVED